MPKLFDVVAITNAFPNAGPLTVQGGTTLAAGAQGTIVDDFGTAYMIEFLDDDGYTIAVETVPANEVTLVWEAPDVRHQSAG